MSFEVKFDDKGFNRAVDDALKKVDDLTIPLNQIAENWYSTNKVIFAQKGKGKYEDLSPKYKILKKRDVGFVYPILKRSGKLADSVTNPRDSSAIHDILNKRTLVLSTSVPYGPYHQSGTSKMPARPFLFLGNEPLAPTELRKRPDKWIQIIKDYVLSVSEGIGE